MKLLRNAECKRTLLACVLLCVAALLGCAWLGIAHWGWMLLVCVGFCALLWGNLYWRYRKIAELSAQIDLILHGETELSLPQSEEGELSLLRSEIGKMTLRLREQSTQLQQDKTRLSDALADISHQIRTPLTSLHLQLSLLRNPALPMARQREILLEMSQQLQRIDFLVGSLLKLSKLDAGTAALQHTTLPLEVLLQNALSPLLVSLDLHNITLHQHCRGNFTGDLPWSSEALTNIVKNCMEHTPAGGCIELVAQETALFSEIVVQDHGSGIPAGDLPRIFERFYRGQNAAPGSVGIGLALAQRIMSAQNGTLRAENTPQGARFVLRFYKGTV